MSNANRSKMKGLKKTEGEWKEEEVGPKVGRVRRLQTSHDVAGHHRTIWDERSVSSLKLQRL